MEQLRVIQSKIYEFRGVKVMLNFDLAKLYSTETSLLKLQGVAMLSSVLRSDIAIKVNINIMRAFAMINQIGEEALEAINDLSEDNRKEFDSIYLALSQLADKQKLINKPRNPIGFIKQKE